MPRIPTLNDLASTDSTLANNPYLQNLHISSSQSTNNSTNPTTNNSNSRPKNKKNKKKQSNQCPHPGNEWIINLLQERSKKQTGHKQYHPNAYKKAITNLKKFPFKITNEHNAQEVDGIGPSIAKLIKQKLIQRQELMQKDPNQQIYNARQNVEKQNKTAQKNENKKKRKKNKKKPQKGPFVPQYRKGGYALLIHLYDMYKNNDVQGLSKEQLLRDAQQYCDCSFTQKKNDYTSWSSMSKLIKCAYVNKMNHGNKGSEYFLTVAGQSVAARLYAQMNGDTIPPVPDQSIFNEVAWPRGSHNDNNDNDNNDGQSHAESKPKFNCEYPNCDKAYNSKGWLDSHIENKHKNKNENNNNNNNQIGRKRNNNDMMELDDIEHLPKRRRIDVELFDDDNNNCNDIDVTKPIKIGGEYYLLYLIYDTSEKRTKNSQERIQLETAFDSNRNSNAINNKQYRLPIGDFCWTLMNTHRNIEYLYPIIIERKRKDDLAQSIKDKRYIEQKWRIKKNLPYFSHIYLIEDYSLDLIMKKRVKTALINTNVRDHFYIYETESLPQSIQCLKQWTQLIYKQILKKNNNVNFFKDEKCLLFEEFISLTDVKKNLNIPAKILFGRQLMSVNGVTDIIAKQIALKYPTMRNLYIGYGMCDTEEDERLLLYNQVNGTCLEWHRDLDSGKIELDEDLRNQCRAIDNDKYKPISKHLSEKIWRALYCDEE